MNFIDSHNINDHTVLTKEQYDQVVMLLSNLSDKLQVISMILLDSTGRIIAQKQSESYNQDSEVLATLAAGSAAAAKEMLRLLGENNHNKMILYEGNQINVYISVINDNYALIIAFDTGVALGMVRLITKKTIIDLQKILSLDNQQIHMNKVFDRHFQSLLGDELDRSFKENI